MKYELEYVEWLDHCSHGRGWKEVKDLQENDWSPILVVSVGWVIKETKKYIVIIPHHDTTGGNCQGSMTIIKSCIKKRKRLKTRK